jgi:putative inorganic carbon (HCO3(-)) transporter
LSTKPPPSSLIARACGWSLGYELLIVGLVVAASVVNVAFSTFALVMIVLFWGIRRVATGHLSTGTPADGAIGLLLLMLLITFLITAYPELTRVQVYRTLIGIGIYYSVVNWGSSLRRIRLLMLGTMCGNVLLALAAFISVEWIVGKFAFLSGALYKRLPILVSDTVHPNVMAGALVILLAPALARLLFTWPLMRPTSRLLTTASILGIVCVLFLTQSRAGVLAFYAEALLLLILRWRRAWLVLVAAHLGAASIVMLLGVNTVANAVHVERMLQVFAGRNELWSHAIDMIQDFPFTGIGMGSFAPVADRFYPMLVATPTPPHAHQLFLQVALDVGLPGLVAWLAILLVVMVSAWSIYRYGKIAGDRWAQALGAGLLASQVALIVQGLLDAVTWGMVRTAVIPWALWGLTMAVLNVYRPWDAERPSSALATE